MYIEKNGNMEIKNEPVLDYGPGSPEKKALRRALTELKDTPLEIPLVIGGQRIYSGPFYDVIAPQNKHKIVARYQKATKANITDAISKATTARHDWNQRPWPEKKEIFNKAAELTSVKYRYLLNAASMLGQGKTVYQAEIDAACETADYFRFNAEFLEEIMARQPPSISGQKNHLEARGLEGFVLTVSPFNFTAIGANLASAPALMGTPVIWKPASTALLSNYFVFQILEEAGIPPGVINFVPGDGHLISGMAFSDPHFSGLNFTGSTSTFRLLWQQIAQNLAIFRNYPRIAGETGGKGFIFVHESANPETVITAIIRGAFEYQGQKCSAASRVYIPRNLWEKIEQRLIFMTNDLTMGDPEDFRNFMGAVIDQSSFNRIKRYIEEVKVGKGAKIITGGEADDSEGFYIRPTIILVSDPRHQTMMEEIFGPVVSIYIYDENKIDKALDFCDDNPYALTGAVFSEDEKVTTQIKNRLIYAAGNFYINDKPTGAVVGLQPFGGSRLSGTNEKAGGPWSLLKWATFRTIKENFSSPKDYKYPYMLER